jgi:hypothetical protein
VRWLGLLLVALAASLPVLHRFGIDVLGAQSAVSSEESPFDYLPTVDPHLPPFMVNASLRARDGGGIVLQLQNTLPDVQDATIVCLNPANKTARKFTVKTWPSGKTIEIGDFDGWDISMGQRIFIQAPGYQPTSMMLNR